MGLARGRNARQLRLDEPGGGWHCARRMKSGSRSCEAGRRIARTALLWAGALGALAAAAGPPADYWLAWSDECGWWDTSKFDHWLYGARRDAYNTWEAVTHSGGIRYIRTYTEGGKHYTGMISTQGRFQERFGYWEARIDYTGQRGMWSAFWLQSPTMGNPIGDVARAGAEIDISEHREYDSSGSYIAAGYDINTHWDGYGADHKSAGSREDVGNARWGYHKYGLLWSPGSYRFDYDDGTVWTSYSGISHRPEFIVLSSEVDNDAWAWTIPSGGYGTNGASSNPQVWIDYVRWYAPSDRVYWSGGGGSDSWGDTNNWVGQRTPLYERIVSFTGFAEARRAHSLDAERWVAGLCVTEPGDAITISSHLLHIGSSGIDMEVANQNLTLACDVRLQVGQAWQTGSRTVTASGQVSGGGSLTKYGAGTVSLTGSNTFTGPVYVEEGRLGIGHPNALGTTDGGTAARTDAQVLILASGATDESFWINGAGLDDDGALRVGGGASFTVNGRVYLDGDTMIKLDGGTSLVLNNPTNAAKGTDRKLTLAGDGGSVGTIRGAVTVGDGRVLKNGAGTWVVARDQDWSAARVYVKGGTLRLDDATVVTADWGGIGQESGDGGTLRLSGTARYISTHDFNIADVSNTTGTLEIESGATLLAKAFYVGKFGNAFGTVNHRGTVSNSAAVSDWRIGGGNSANDVAARGAYNMLSGSFYTPGNLQVGAYGMGAVIQAGGTMTVGGWPSIGRFSGSTGTLSIAGGSFSQTHQANRLIVGESGAGALIVSGTASLDCAGGLRIGQEASGRGTVRLNGGVATVRQVETTGGLSALFFNGGTLRARTNYTAFLQGLGQAEFEAGGGVIDSAGWAVSVAQTLSGSGGLRKAGAGELELRGESTYAGGTVVSGGTLRVSNSAGSATGEGAVQILAGATLSGTGALSGAVTVAGTVAPGDSAGVLTTGAQTWPGGGLYVWEVAGTNGPADGLQVQGTLAIGATAAQPFTVRVVSLNGASPGPLPHFNPDVPCRWRLVSASGGVTGLAPGAVGVDASGFANALDGGRLLLERDADGLWLAFRPAWQVPRVLALASTAGGDSTAPAEVSGSGFAGVYYGLEAATNLLPPALWTPIATNPADPLGRFLLLDPQATNFTRRFYRVLELR